MARLFVKWRVKRINDQPFCVSWIACSVSGCERYRITELIMLTTYAHALTLFLQTFDAFSVVAGCCGHYKCLFVVYCCCGISCPSCTIRIAVVDARRVGYRRKDLRKASFSRTRLVRDKSNSRSCPTRKNTLGKTEHDDDGCSRTSATKRLTGIFG